MIQLPNTMTFIERGWLSSNQILLVDQQSTTLIDTGYCTHSEQTLQLATQSLAGRSLDFIWNTHLHSDHCGGNAALQRQFQNVKTFIPRGLAEHVSNWNELALSYEPTGQVCPKFKHEAFLENGQILTAGNLHWEVHAAPGHDEHAVMLFNPENGILISADALWENGFGVVFPEIENEPGFDDVEQTLNLIESLAPTIVLPGHGNAFTNVSKAIEVSRSKLTSFIKYPKKHAIYASKVLIKFKLLELQQVNANQFHEWMSKTSYLVRLHQFIGKEYGFNEWALNLLDELQKSGSIQINDNQIVNIL
jgi:glyoxylase-like metal-dependent hydrolase (beta-lactamase superfamily II)